MARALLRFKKQDTAYWVQDYHFLALGAELRNLGITQPLGFFLHTPWPPRSIIEGAPIIARWSERCWLTDLSDSRPGTTAIISFPLSRRFLILSFQAEL